MAETLVDPVLIDMLEQYLLVPGERTVLDCLMLHIPEFVRLAEESDGLHWGLFSRGKNFKMLARNHEAKSSCLNNETDTYEVWSAIN